MSIVDHLTAWLKGQVAEARVEGVVMGLSGGIDSAVVGVLAKRALGDNVLGLIMPCYSSSADKEDALLVASKFGIRTITVELSPVFDAFRAVLPEGDRLAVSNIKARLRMVTLYYYSRNLRYLVAGTGNKSELMTGYFTKYGDGGVDVLPLGGLLKTEVWQLARELGIPGQVIAKPPSAGLWPDQTDEHEMGVSYPELDQTLRCMEKGDTGNCTQEVLRRVLELNGISEHKRRLPPIFRPAEG